MRQISYIFVAVIMILAANAVDAFGQRQAENYYKKGKLVEIKDLLSGDENCSVDYKRYGGTVLSVLAAGDGPIESFVLRTAKGPVKIFLPSTLYAERLSKADANALPSLIAKGRRLTVDTQRCGPSRKSVTAAYIIAGIQMDVLG